MRANRILMVTCTLGAIGAWVSAVAVGCSANTTETETKGEGGDGTGAGPATGGGGTGGAGGAVSNLCGMDCSGISTPICFESVCNEGLQPGPIGACVVVPVEDSTGCDDGQFCTVNDTCISGQCTGGPQNDCGIAPPQCELVTCDEASSSCTTAPAANGDACDPMDLCVIGATCTNGLCTGGTTNGCFFEPVPNECHNSVCNPMNGVCEPVVGNDGAPCVDQMDFCSIANTCAAGVCSGGSPKDCSALTVGCFDGVCDGPTGQCMQVPIVAGGNCAAATDDCNQGICDMAGMCNPVAVNENGACNVDNCFAGQTCTAGTCQNGSQILTCVDGDLCCPAGCNIATDQDCLTEITLAALNTGHSGSIQDGALTGVAAADSMCNTQAAANGIGGVWKSFMCDTSQDAINLVPAFLQGFPVVNLDGLVLWNNWAEVFSTTTWIGAGAKMKSFSNLIVDEPQVVSPVWLDADSWHGCLATGLLDAANHCSNWTSTVGNGAGGELDFGNFMDDTDGNSPNVCTQTSAVVCVRISN